MVAPGVSAAATDGKPATLSRPYYPDMGHKNNFDGLRLIAALAVLYSHQFMLVGQAQPAPYANLPLGTYAVYAFFAISGYLVTLSWQRDPDPLRFAMKRALRIAPAYIVVRCAVPIVLLALGRTDFTGNVFADLNGSLWTIPLEIACYATFLILATSTPIAPFALLAASLAVGLDNDFERFFGYFALGSVFAAVPALMRSRVLAVIAALGLAIAAGRHTYYGVQLLLVASVLGIGTASWAGLRSAGRFGDLSYGVYLLAYPVQQLWLLALGADANFLLLLILSALTALGLAGLSWRYIEAPALRLKYRVGQLGIAAPREAPTQ